MIVKSLKFFIMGLLSNGATWEWNNIQSLVEDQVKRGKLKMRTDPFPNGEERIPKYAMRAMLELRDEGKVIHVSRGRWKKRT